MSLSFSSAKSTGKLFEILALLYATILMNLLTYLLYQDANGGPTLQWSKIVQEATYWRSQDSMQQRKTHINTTILTSHICDNGHDCSCTSASSVTTDIITENLLWKSNTTNKDLPWRFGLYQRRSSVENETNSSKSLNLLKLNLCFTNLKNMFNDYWESLGQWISQSVHTAFQLL